MDQLKDLGVDDKITFKSVIVCGHNSRDPLENQQRPLMNTAVALDSLQDPHKYQQFKEDTLRWNKLIRKCSRFIYILNAGFSGV
jgi:hypothetical protein